MSEPLTKQELDKLLVRYGVRGFHDPHVLKAVAELRAVRTAHKALAMAVHGYDYGMGIATRHHDRFEVCRHPLCRDARALMEVPNA